MVVKAHERRGIFEDRFAEDGARLHDGRGESALADGRIACDHAGRVEEDRLEDLAREIRAAFEGTDKLVVVGLLRGSFVFIADLVRELGDMPVEVDFLEASSYGDAMESSREVRILKDLRGEIAGRDVLVVEDIVDTGHTLAHVVKFLGNRSPRRLETIALLDKPSRREVEVSSDWIGFEIPDEFVVGYGIDFAQRNRNLPYIGKVRFT